MQMTMQFDEVASHQDCSFDAPLHGPILLTYYRGDALFGSQINLVYKKSD